MTKLLILGLLDTQPMSGYDLQQKIGRADARRWGGVLPGSIYYALKKLEEEGDIALAEVGQTGRRQRAVYAITPQGRRSLQTLVRDVLRTPVSPYPTELFSGLSLLDRLPRPEAVQALRERRKRLAAEYDVLLQKREGNTGQVVSRIAALTIDHMFALVQQQQKFVESVLAALEEEPG